MSATLIADKIGLEILSNRFQAVVDEMAQALFRTAHTVFVKETQDYGAALVTRGGEVFAAPRRYGVLMMIGMPMDDAIRCIEGDVAEGDVFISNDPEATRGMCTHLSDVFLWQPIFWQGALVCYAWSFIHMSDVGGRVPGSIAPSRKASASRRKSCSAPAGSTTGSCACSWPTRARPTRTGAT